MAGRGTSTEALRRRINGATFIRHVDEREAAVIRENHSFIAAEHYPSGIYKNPGEIGFYAGSDMRIVLVPKKEK